MTEQQEYSIAYWRQMAEQMELERNEAFVEVGRLMAERDIFKADNSLSKDQATEANRQRIDAVRAQRKAEDERDALKAQQQGRWLCPLCMAVWADGAGERHADTCPAFDRDLAAEVARLTTERDVLATERVRADAACEELGQTRQLAIQMGRERDALQEAHARCTNLSNAEAARIEQVRGERDALAERAEWLEAERAKSADGAKRWCDTVVRLTGQLDAATAALAEAMRAGGEARAERDAIIAVAEQMADTLAWIARLAEDMLGLTVLNCPPPWPALDRRDIAAICEADGFGFVMQVASYLWQCRDATGAHISGPALGTAQEMQTRITQAMDAYRALGMVRPGGKGV